MGPKSHWHELFYYKKLTFIRSYISNIFAQIILSGASYLMIHNWWVYKVIQGHAINIQFWPSHILVVWFFEVFLRLHTLIMFSMPVLIKVFHPCKFSLDSGISPTCCAPNFWLFSFEADDYLLIVGWLPPFIRTSGFIFVSRRAVSSRRTDDYYLVC